MKHSYFSIFSPKKYIIQSSKQKVWSGGWIWTTIQNLVVEHVFNPFCLSKNWDGSRSLGHFFELYLVSMVICHSYLSLPDGMRLLKMVKGLVLKQNLGDQPPWRSWPRQVLIHHLPAFPGSMVGFTNHGNYGFHMGNQGKPNTKCSFFFSKPYYKPNIYKYIYIYEPY